MLITTERLMYLNAIVEHGSFSAAARKFGVSASAVNQVIQNMEIDLDITLFERRAGKAPELTAAGKVIYFQGLELVPRLDAIEKKAKSLKSGVEPTLTIALHGLTFFPRFQEAIIQLTHQYPELELVLVDSEEIGLSELGESGADMVIGPSGLIPKRGCEISTVDEIHWCFVCSPSHPLAKIKAGIGNADLAKYVQLLPSIGRVATADLVESMRHSPKVVQCDRLYQIRELLLSGMGFAFYPSQLAQPLVESGQLVQLQVDFLNSTLTWPIDITWTQAIGVAGMTLIDGLID
ncbi:LysR family transcriptional regulator [Vibrio amylolyticus]|uniref:LysR family transcriptional regulator n=1 Tax=Vibrio amylolyticus TaxID=2847292 RepID=UPI00354F9E06